MALFQPAVTDVIQALLPPLLQTLDRLQWVQRQLHPPIAARLAERLAPDARALQEALAACEALTWPDDLTFLRDRLVDASRRTLESVTRFVAAAGGSGEVFDLYRALRRLGAVQETLYPLAPAFDQVSRWFLDPGRRGDEALVARLREAALRDDGPRVGLLHADNARDQRGGFSLYVPEGWDGQAPMALVVALHGGHGHGRDFVWSWLREARSRGVLVLAPTSVERTWSIMGGADVDADRLGQGLAAVSERYPLDRRRVLLTGMSDGATYAFLCGLREATPFTHLAPLCGVLHPFLLGGGLARAAGRPIYLVHGARDWMFPVAIARAARDALLAAGARLVYRELADLSHTYPREENTAILDWLLGDAALTASPA